MGYYKDAISFLKDFPKSLIREMMGTENPDDAKMKKRYHDAMNRYRDEYWEAVKMGITREELKTLGIDQPDPKLQVSGVGGGGGGGFPIIPILTPPAINLPVPTEEDIQQVEAKIQAIDDAEDRRRRPPEPPATPNPVEEEKFERIMTNTRGVSTGINSSVTLAVIENLLAESTKGTVRLNKPTKEQLKNAKAFKLEGEKRSKKVGTRGRDIIRRLWTDNPKLWQDILDILVKYGKVKKSDLSFGAKDYESINELSDRLFNNTGIDSERLNREIMKRLKEEARRRNAPQWYIDIFDDTPMDVNVDNPDMAPSIRNDPIYRPLLRNMTEQLRGLGIAVEDADRMAMKLIEYYASSKQLDNIVNSGDFVGGVNETIGMLLDSFSDVIRDARQRFDGSFTVNMREFTKAMFKAINIYIEEKDKKLKFFDKVQVFRDLINQVITEAERKRSTSSSSGYRPSQVEPITMSPNELGQELKRDFSGDIIHGHGMRIRNSDVERKVNPEDMPTPDEIQEIKLQNDLNLWRTQDFENKIIEYKREAGANANYFDFLKNVFIENIRSTPRADWVRRVVDGEEVWIDPRVLDNDAWEGTYNRVSANSPMHDIGLPPGAEPPDGDPDDPDDDPAGGGGGHPSWDPRDPRRRPPEGDPDPPDDPSRGDMVDFYFRGAWRRISLRTLIKALIIAGATAGTIYRIYKRLSKQEEYNGEDEEDEDDDDEENNQSDNIEDDTVDKMKPFKPIGPITIDPDPNNRGTLHAGGAYYKPVNDDDVVWIGGKPNKSNDKPDKSNDKPDKSNDWEWINGKWVKKTPKSVEEQLADLRKQYLQIFQEFVDAKEKGASKKELQEIAQRLIDVRNKIEKLKENMVDDDGEDEQPVAPAGGEEGEGETNGETNGEVPVPPTSGAGGDDPDTIVQFGDTDQSFTPDFVDPAEANLFLSTTKEAEEEQKRWARYSLVKPGFGLGSINQNPLAMHNFQAEKKRFTNCFKPQKPEKAPSKQAVERKWSPQMAPYWYPAIQNEYGDVQFEDSFYNNKMAQSFTNPIPVDNRRSTWENPKSIYHPENSLATYHCHGVRIPELRNRAGYYGVNKPPSTQGGFTNNRKVYDDMYKYSKMMSSDYQNKKSDVSNDISYSLPRNGSARFA